MEELEREVEEYRERLATVLGTSVEDTERTTQGWGPSRPQPGATSSAALPFQSNSRPGLRENFERCFAVDTRSIPDVGPLNPRAAVLQEEDDVDEIMVRAAFPVSTDLKGPGQSWIPPVHNPTSAFHHTGTKSGSSARTAPNRRNMRKLANQKDPHRFSRFLPDVFLTKLQHDAAVDRFFRYFASFGTSPQLSPY